MPTRVNRTGPDTGLAHHALIYIRVSTTKQDDSGLSLEQQEADAIRYARGKDLRVVEVLKDVCSASKPMHKRPKGAVVMELLKTRKAHHLIVCKLDRIFRSIQDMVTTMHDLQTLGAALHIVEHSMDYSTPIGRLLLSILTSTAQFERELASERTKSAIRAKRARGEKLGGSIPYGQLPGEAANVARAMLLRSRGFTFRRTCEQMAKEGRTTRAGTPWNASNLHRLLKRLG